MKPLWTAIVIALGGLLVLAFAVPELAPHTSLPLYGLFNLWILGTVVVLTVGIVGAYYRFVVLITDRHDP